jgi:hypothetical protein
MGKLFGILRAYLPGLDNPGRCEVLSSKRDRTKGKDEAAGSLPVRTDHRLDLVYVGWEGEIRRAIVEQGQAVENILDPVLRAAGAAHRYLPTTGRAGRSANR